MLAPYLPIVLLFALAAAFALFSVTIAPFVGPRRFNRAKLDFYECGIEPTPQPIGPHRFPIKYFLTAMIFIVFDIEIIFLYPWAVETRAVAGAAFGLFLLVEMIIFILVVFVAYAYVWRRGGLDWD
jgi:NADH-quinone oxidoreductase subunit A